MHIRTYLLCLILAMANAASLAQADEVTLPYKGLTLNADLTLAPGKAAADEVILLTHGSLAHRDMETIATLRKLLNERGYNTLAINLSLGLDNRHGMYDCKTTHRHKNDDAVDEIGVWMDWLKGKGAKSVTLLGHSRGGAQTALYAAERDSPLLNAVVLLAPATAENNNAASYQRRFKNDLAPTLNKARKLIQQRKGDTVLQRTSLINCADTAVTAEAFASYYDGGSRLDTPHLLPKISKPTLVLVAEKDDVVVGLEKKIAPLTGTQVQVVTISGADHFFRDLNADEAVDAVDAFLKRISHEKLG